MRPRQSQRPGGSLHHDRHERRSVRSEWRNVRRRRQPLCPLAWQCLAAAPASEASECRCEEALRSRLSQSTSPVDSWEVLASPRPQTFSQGAILEHNFTLAQNDDLDPSRPVEYLSGVSGVRWSKSGREWHVKDQIRDCRIHECFRPQSCLFRDIEQARLEALRCLKAWQHRTEEELFIHGAAVVIQRSSKGACAPIGAGQVVGASSQGRGT